ncbi:hypothetical protein Huta_2132 [Halorhabdus utahensis DSM 12940]|uniref:Uncharacterized protein n=1 Tax=Halorhabdus utahensis (strain DSM 12940 / JCM 11049 / AX-2) TaxID=519442 RepID=C7NU54_HALUD|nr:hypothetical protein [Halorhabdus utahensis]ACV12299.1 hypothetical protein Huta_2132 [Halorhabdus utahensis DSM 12940]
MGGKLSNGDVSDAQQPADSGAYVVEDEDGNRRVVQDPTAESTGSDREATTADFQTAATGSVAVLVSGPRQHSAGPLPSSVNATIWAGAYDDSSEVPVGIADEQLDITVTRPDGTTESFIAQTDKHGSASVDYDLSASNRGDGSYDVTVTDSNETSTSITVEVGTIEVMATTDGVSNGVFVGKETTFAFLVHEAATGVQDVELTLRVTRNGNAVKESTVLTDADGFAQISFTPDEKGMYQIKAIRNGFTVESTTVNVVEYIGGGYFDLRQALVGSTSTYGGYVYTSNGHVSNFDIVMSIYAGDVAEENLLTEQTVTTNNGGFFTVDYDVPSDIGAHNLEARAETDDGEPISLEFDYIRLNESSEGGGGDPDPVQLSGSKADWGDKVPGETVTIDIEAIDDGTAISEEPIDVFLRYDYQGPPAFSTTVTTGNDGTTSVNIPLPENAPDASQLQGSVGMTYNGTTYTDSIWANIQRYDISFNYPDVVPGTTEPYRINVTNNATGDAVEGIEYYFDAVYQSGQCGSFETGKLVSGSDGTDEMSVQVPEDVEFWSGVTDITQYDSGTGGPITFSEGPGTVSTDDTIVAGRTAEFTFSVPEDVSLSGIAFSEGPYQTTKTFGTLIDGSGTFSLTIPSEFPEGETFELRVWAVDEQGNIYEDENWFEIDDGGSLPIALEASAEKNVPVGGQAQLSLSAQKVDLLSIEKLWSDWNLVNSATGGTVADDITNAGRVDIDYSSVQNSASPSLTLSLPERYVGGKYSLLVSGTDPDGKTVDTTATLTIE